MKSLQVKTLSLFLVASLLLFLLDTAQLLNPVKTAAQIVFLPAEEAVHSVKIGLDDTFSFLTFWRSGESRIKNLEQRNLELLTKANQADSLASENADLRAQLGVKPLAGNTLLPARVLGLDRYLGVAAGADDGVRSDMTVVYLGNYVGKVKTVSPKSSFVELPTDPDTKISAKIGVTGTVHGLISGQFNSSITLDHVAQEEDMKVGDQVFTDDNLLIGSVVSIDSKDTDLFKRATIQPQITTGKLTTVFIILK